jgi:hypothetical protein
VPVAGVVEGRRERDGLVEEVDPAHRGLAGREPGEVAVETAFGDVRDGQNRIAQAEPG